MPLNDKIANLMLFKAGSLCHRKLRGKKQLTLDISIKCRGCHFQEDGAVELNIGTWETMGRAGVSQMGEALKARAIGRPWEDGRVWALLMQKWRHRALPVTGMILNGSGLLWLATCSSCSLPSFLSVSLFSQGQWVSHVTYKWGIPA